MIVLVDMDGPLANFEEAFLKKWKEAYPDQAFISLEDRRGFYIAGQYAEEHRGKVRELYGSEGFAENLLPVPGSLDFMKKALAIGHEVFICTSPLAKYEPNVLEKYRWVDRHLGSDFVKRMVITRDKTLIKGDFLVDDRPAIEGVADPEWRHVVFDAPYNRASIQPLRIHGDWSNWEEVLTA